MHEMGHIASYLSKPFVGTVAYSYPTQCTGCGSWNLGTPEWLSAGFEEGLATFLGDVAMYWHWAVEPTTCLSTSSCNAWSIEDSAGDGNCAADEHRWPISTDRYLWDIYDTVDDTTYTDSVNIHYWQFFTTLENYSSGFANYQCDEPWTNSNYNVVDDWDGRDQEAFYFSLVNKYDVISLGQAIHNCVP
jgi:hypothetical protein